MYYSKRPELVYLYHIRGSVMAGFAYEKQRVMRMLFPKSHDRAAWLLMNAVGRPWLLLTGWKREYRILTDQGYLVLDLAHPRLKLCLEGDGERWHMDVVRETIRDERLRELNWSVRHYRFPKLKNEPRKVRREVRRWYWRSLLWNYRR